MLVTYQLVICKIKNKCSVLIKLIIMNCLQYVSKKEKYGIYARNNGHLLQEIGTIFCVFSWRKGSKVRPQSNNTFIKKCPFYI